MHHAWLLAGKPESGTKAFARAAAADLVGTDDTERGDFHPDIICLQREPKEDAKATDGKPAELRRNITIAQIRALQKRLTTKPSAGKGRAVIIDTVDDLEQGASNALLKSLEEPPPGTVFLLIAHYPARLLPTIRSRCRLLRFSSSNADPESADDPDLVRAVLTLTAASPDDTRAVQGFLGTIGARPTKSRLQEAITAGQSLLASRIGDVNGQQFARVDRTYMELGVLADELASYNYDGELLAVRIGTLLTGLGASIDGADG